MQSFELKNFTGQSEHPFFIQYGAHDESLDIHIHEDFFELTVVLDGTAKHVINGEEYFIKKGDVFGVDHKTPHAFIECHDFKICNIMFRPETFFLPFPQLKHCSGFHALFVLEPDMSKEQGFKSRLRLNVNDFEKAEQLINSMIEEYHKCDPGFMAMVTAYFIELVCFLSRRYDDNVEDDMIASFAKGVAFIERSFTENITSEEIAANAGYSLRHFQRQFKKTYLINPQQYIFALRMQKAMTLLAQTKESITEIAFQCGYQDSSLFARRFKSHTGISPREYRKKEFFFKKL